MNELRELATELAACLADVLDADGDLYAMDFDRYRTALARAIDADLYHPNTTEPNA